MPNQEVLQTNFDTDEFLAHFGILGMKWGIRRFQNKDGSLTSAGKKRYGLSKKDIELGKDIEDNVIEKSIRKGKSYKETKEEIKKYCEDNIEKLESYKVYKKSQMMQRGINTVAMLISYHPGLAASFYGSDKYSTVFGPNGLGVADIFKSNTKRKYDYFKNHMLHDAFDTDDNAFLAHHGILGQKWGIRRYQNEDGSLTQDGKERYSRTGGRNTREIYNVKSPRQAYIYRGRYSDSELKEITNRFRDELALDAVSKKYRRNGFIILKSAIGVGLAGYMIKNPEKAKNFYEYGKTIVEMVL